MFSKELKSRFGCAAQCCATQPKRLFDPKNEHFFKNGRKTTPKTLYFARCDSLLCFFLAVNEGKCSFPCVAWNEKKINISAFYPIKWPKRKKA